MILICIQKSLFASGTYTPVYYLGGDAETVVVSVIEVIEGIIPAS